MTWQIALAGAGVLIAGFTIWLFLWRKDEQNRVLSNVEAETSKQALENAKHTLDEEAKVRERYDELRQNYPDSWADVARMRPKDPLPTKPKN